MLTEPQKNVSLAPFNSLALPALAGRYVRVTASEQLMALTGTRRCFVLGGGSNLVLTGDFDGLVLHMAISGRALIGEDAHAWRVRAGAGENWHDFVQWTLAQGWPGLENLSLIPGTAGAAPVQNIGAYGLEVAERFLWLTAFDLQTGKSARFEREDCRFGYRDSVFKREGWHLNGRYVITEIVFELPKRWTPLTGYADIGEWLAARRISTPSPGNVADAVISARRRKLPDPARLPNVGSFFQNPAVDETKAVELLELYPDLPRYPQPDGRVKLSAGWLIERAGWKGKRIGPVGMYEKHALVLVNHGGARGLDVVALTRAVQSGVSEKFGVELQPEPVFL
ncbi:MAG: UDP-N-acetylmuramate dehydrogenase [Candidatus Accumulibacter sp.]|jgi:UDP-N-acetylmuramate dehydrogenase|nr:UDP-N-acetylmuramate dehydrogenase [Accumulibacter sp.]